MQFLTAANIVFGVFVLVTASLLFYYLYFFRRLAFYKPKIKKEFQQHPVSVIVCARDEDENLARNVPGLIFQKYEGTLQILIVNDNSIDDTKYILQELNKEFFQKLTILELRNEAKLIAGKKYPLSMGIRESRHEILMLTDADCVPASEYWVQKMQDAFNEGIDIVLGYGAYRKLPGFLNKAIRFETFHSALQYFSYALAGLPYMGVGRNLSYKKNLFLNNKGFSSISHLPGGDDDLFISKVATKKNTAIVIDCDAHTLSEPKRTWQAWRSQKMRHFSTSKYYKPIHKFLLGFYSLSHFLFYPLAIASAIMFDWRSTLALFAIKLIVQAMVYAKAMRQLEESDLIKWIFVMDIWMLFYYLFFAPALWKKESRAW